MRISLSLFSVASSSSSATSTSARPLKLAIIGGGPSGFYAASRLLSRLPADSPEGKDVEVHVYERLPAPHGLVRYGVAPDHPEVKNVQHKFDLLENDPRFQFFGNVSIGSPPPPPAAPPSGSASTSLAPPYSYPHALHIPLSTLLPHYTHLLLSHGSSLSASLPNLAHSATSSTPLQNVHPALAFVSWYNGHPAYTNLSPSLDKAKHVTIIGQGNVALDCARILLKGADGLSETDVPESVLDVLRRSTVETVEVVGRRGPGQVAFTTKEFREMMALDGVAFELGCGEDARAEAEAEVKRIGGSEERMRTRILGLMKKGSTSKGDKKTKTFKLSFLKTPLAYNPASTTDGETGPIGSITYGLNKLLAPQVPSDALGLSHPPPHQPDLPAPAALAMLTGEKEVVETDMVIESVGYRSEGIEGARQAVPFDGRKGRVRNLGGRVVDEDGQPVANTYTVGWASRGPIGVIASTMYDSYSTIDLLLADHENTPLPAPKSTSASSSFGRLNPRPSSGPPPEIAAAKGVRGEDGRVVGYGEWKRIEAAEIAKGKELGKRAEKFVEVQGMLGVLTDA